MNNTILIFGGGGQLGGALAQIFREHGWSVIAPSHEEVDVSDAKHVREFIVEHQPSIVVNSAWFSVQNSEADPTSAYRINAVGAHASAIGAREVGATAIYISTDYVFDGTKEDGFSESDCPNPINVYGASKLAGEHLTRIANSSHYIIRTSALFGLHAKPLGNFVLKMKARTDANEPTWVVDDQTTCPTSADDLAVCLYQMVEGKAQFGVYHVVNGGSATWYDVALKVFQRQGKEAMLSKSKTVKEVIARPHHSILRSEKITQKEFVALPHWEDALRRYFMSF